jgi:hypothetical protein
MERVIAWIKGVTANSLRNLAEIGNQPVDGTRRDHRWSLGGRGRVLSGTVPGGLNPHSEVGSGGLGCHDDHSRLLGQPHSRVEQAHHPVLHHPDNGQGATVAKMRLQGARLLARRDVREGQVRLGGELLVQGLAALAPQVGLGDRHGGRLSVSRR